MRSTRNQGNHSRGWYAALAIGTCSASRRTPVDPRLSASAPTTDPSVHNTTRSLDWVDQNESVSRASSETQPNGHSNSAIQRASGNHQPTRPDHAKDPFARETSPSADRAGQDHRSLPINNETPTIVCRLVPAASPLAYRPEFEAAPGAFTPDRPNSPNPTCQPNIDEDIGYQIVAPLDQPKAMIVNVLAGDGPSPSLLHNSTDISMYLQGNPPVMTPSLN